MTGTPPVGPSSRYENVTPVVVTLRTGAAAYDVITGRLGLLVALMATVL